jgi:hypothetical protein
MLKGYNKTTGKKNTHVFALRKNKPKSLKFKENQLKTLGIIFTS